ncbi:GspE/PulE/PilB domain-containing protein [Hyalangium versicolor]|uniref:GspE/PulE/PilB domain-containing protein n=1 Tax=Hyalangium versicolor TaxID=2861190 RepID=UPI001CCDDB44|nr:ATPase [Hyalangium versicolor]
MRKKRLGDLLLEKGLVDDIQLRAALGFHYKWGVPLGQVVVDKGFCTAQQVLELLSSQEHLPAIDLDQQTLDPSLVDLLPVETAEACRVIPLRVEGLRQSELVVAVAAPARPTVLDEVARVAGKSRVVALLATDRAVSRAIDRLYYPHLIGAERPIEPIPLPEADEHLPLVTDRAEYLMIARVVQSGAPVPTVEQNGLPVMLPLAADVPFDARVTEPEMPKVAAVPEPEVWVYGWGAQATEGLMKLLADEGLRARVARTEDVLKASPRTVVLTPLQSVESVKRHGIRAQLLVAGRAHDRDRALAMGAHTFLSGPLRTDQLIREVRERAGGGLSPMRQAG